MLLSSATPAMSSARTMQIVAGAALIALSALALVTWQALRLEASEARTRSLAQEQQSLRLALWRMDSLMTPVLAREAARPYFEYQSFYPADRAYTDVFHDVSTLGVSEVLVPSPLLGTHDPFIRLHFERVDGDVFSPQVPSGAARRTAEAAYVTPYAVERRDADLAALQDLLAQPLAPPVAQSSVVASPTSRSEQTLARVQQASDTAERDALPQGGAGSTALEDANPASPRLATRSDALANPTADAAPTSTTHTTSNADALTPALSSAAASNIDSVAAHTVSQVPTHPTTAGTDVVSAPSNARPEPPSAASLEAQQRADYETRAALTKQAQTQAQVEVTTNTLLNRAPGRRGRTSDAASPQIDTTADATPALAPPAAPSVSTLALEAAAPASPSTRGDRLTGTARSEGSSTADSAEPTRTDPADPTAAPLFVGAAPEVILTELQPRWVLRPQHQPELLVVRTVRVGEREIEQGFWMNWPALRDSLLATVRDIYPTATLEPIAQSPATLSSTTLGRMLASIPAQLIVPADASSQPLRWTPLRTALVATWLLVLLSLAALVLAIRAMADLAERRGQFVSAVTHELRTPLTTFRLYSQMLSEGMVRDEPTQRAYARTLFGESQRLGRIVESVLEYARLSRPNPAHSAKGRHSVRELAERVTPALFDVASQHAMTLDVQPVPDALASRCLLLDPADLDRILINLVENAGKYAKPDARDAATPADPGTNHRAQLSWQVEGPPHSNRIRIRVRDFGPGIPHTESAAIFLPFTRGSAHTHGSTPGMGLGLSLAGALARQMGGSLRATKPDGPGAQFDLDLPMIAL